MIDLDSRIFGTTATFSVFACSVCFQAVAELTWTSDMRRIAYRQPWGRMRTGSFEVRILRSGHSR